MNMIVRLPNAPYDPGRSTVLLDIPVGADHFQVEEGITSATEKVGGALPYMRATASVQTHNLVPLVFGISRSAESADDGPLPKRQEQEEILAALSPAGRWQYLVKSRSRTLVFILFSTITWLVAAAGTWAKVLGEFVKPAHAQASSVAAQTVPQGLINPSDAILIFLGVCLVGAFALVFFGKDDKKIKSGDDALKVVTGIIAGFMGGKAI